jgi:hypothetical protein
MSTLLTGDLVAMFSVSILEGMRSRIEDPTGSGVGAPDAEQSHWEPFQMIVISVVFIEGRFG